MVPISRYTDRALHHAIGRSILGVWQKVPLDVDPKYRMAP
jgi:hypothetical protein